MDFKSTLNLTEAERHQLLVEWNNTQADYPDVCVHELFEAQVERMPDAIALVAGSEPLTYRELNQRANQLAHYLQAHAVKADGLVGICVERSPEMIIGILGILKAGGAYVPLDPAYPRERLGFMLSNAEVEVLLTSEGLLSTLPQMTHVTHLVCLDRDWEVISQEADQNPLTAVQPNHLAYVIYTSGSTGKPKGGAMEHHSLVNLLWWHMRKRTASCGLKTLQFCAISFDFSFHEIFSTLCFGGPLVLVAEEVRRNPFALAKFIYDNEIEKLFLPVTALQQLAEAVLEEGPIRSSLREVITTGEQLQITPAMIHLFSQTGAILHNHYGATEFQDATTFTLSGDPTDWPALPPIGRPLSNVQIYILDEWGQPVPIGQVGELYIGGVGVARGYLKRPELNKIRFIPNLLVPPLREWASGPSPQTCPEELRNRGGSRGGTGRLYRTGDLARYRANGTIENLGRADYQVKIRGVRIELGEIEAVLAKHPAVRENAVMAHESSSTGHKRLVAYVVSRSDSLPNVGGGKGGAQIDALLHSYLSERLPDYMLPEAFVVLDEMPLTPSGKINRRALPAPKTFRRTLASPVSMPQSETEQLLAKIWEDVLNIEAVGIHDNFFDIGATSLLLIQVHKAVVETFDSKLSTLTLFQYPTIHSLAQQLSQPVKSHDQIVQKSSKIERKSIRKRGARRSDVAIIGMSGRFPDAKDLDTFWQNLRDGVESISFFSDEELQQHDSALLNHPNYVKAGAVLPNIEWFDASFFGISAKEAATMDPQQRLFLECAWEALENAGYNPETYSGSVGVYAGSSISTYLVNNVSPNLGYSANRPLIEADMLQLQVKLGNDRNYLATRVSYKLNLKGPSVNVQTACSTALVAVHLARQSLLNGECDMVLAGGISIIVPHKGGYLYEEGMIRSPDGHCRAFDAQAAGTLFGNGGGIVLLKRLDDALADGDNIVAVIKGSAINNDGALKVGFTAPSIERQVAVIEDALAVAEVDASTITYVEAHGTGTRLGDPIEMAALTQAFERSSHCEASLWDKNVSRQRCAIGSVKTNIGHLDEAAGIAGLIKTALALQHQSIPPSLHFKQPNPQIDFENSPFYVNTELSEWAANAYPRRAGVSSFGMGGTNSHVVLEEAPIIERSPSPFERDKHLLTLSAKTPQALEQLAQRYVDYLASYGEQTSLANICFTANTGRKHFSHRQAFVAESNEQLREQLERFLDSDGYGQEIRALRSIPVGQASKACPEALRIAFLFTGQGSQYVDMGRKLYETQPIFRETLDHCDQILQPYLDRSLLEILYPEARQPSSINETAYTQPALFAVEYALYQLWKSWGIQPDVVMGHSVGEYVAACVAGVFTLSDGLKLIAERGRLMQALPRDGSMVSVMASEARVADLIWPYEGQVAIAAINGPQSVVISGQQEATLAICATLEAEGIKIKRLNVSHAFHSPLMRPMLADFERVTRQVSYSEPKIKLISNVTGQLVNHEVTTADYWVRHVRQSVRFAAGMESLERQGANVFIEIGPKPVLLGMARECLPERQALWLPTLRPKQVCPEGSRGSEGANDWQQLLSSLRNLYLAGVTVDWVGFDNGYTRRRVPLPTYPFQRERYWIEGKEQVPTTGFVTNVTPGEPNHPLIGQRLQLAGTQEIFHAQISPNRPSWLSDHRVFNTIVMPGTAYLEMALAAGAAVSKSDQIKLKDVIIQQAMTFPDAETFQTIQVVLTPNLDELSTRFEIFSLTARSAGTSNEQVLSRGTKDWSLHAFGQFVEQEPPIPEWVDLAVLQAECSQPVSLEALSERFKKQQIDYGPSFEVVKEVWLGNEGVALGLIRLPTLGELPQIDAYQLHPVLLDGVFQVLDATLLDKPETYLPVGLECLRVMAPSASLNIWCHAQLRKAPEDDMEHVHQQHLMADLRLINANGDLMAVMEGVQLKLAHRQAMLGSEGTDASQADWLYEVEWRPLERPSRPTAPKLGEWLIFADSRGIGQQVVERLQLAGHRCTIVFADQEYWQIDGHTFTINPANPRDFERLLASLPEMDGVIACWSLDAHESDLEAAMLLGCGSTLHLVQALVQKYATRTQPRLWLVTQGAQAVNEQSVQQVAQSPLWGMGKVIALEHPDLQVVRVDLDTTGMRDYSYLVNEILSLSAGRKQSAADNSLLEDQVAYRNGVRYVARLVPRQPRPSGLDVPENQPFRLSIAERGTLEQLQLEAITRHAPGAGEVEIQVHAAGLNFIDVLNAMGLYPGTPPLGIECVGEIVVVGEGVTNFESGDRVIAVVPGSFSQYITVDANLVAPMPAALTFSEAATIPEVFLTAYWCLHHLAKIAPRDRVLIHAATGGIGQAAIQWAQAAGAEIFATASKGKWSVLEALGIKYIMNSRTLDFADEVMATTNGEGVDIVLNSLTGEGFIEKSLSVLSNSGCFVELAKRDIWSSLEVARFRPDVSYFVVDMEQECEQQRDLIQTMLRQIVQKVDTGTLKPLSATVFPIQDAVSAFRHMQQAKHTGKIVLTFAEQQAQKEEPLTLRGDGRYLITGGLGGLGLLVARFLVERGAKHLVLVGRSEPKPAACDVITSLQQAGATVSVVQADVSDKAQLAQALGKIGLAEGSPAWRGVIHAAGVLDDGVLLQQTVERFASVMAPKVQGAWNLHTLMQDEPLDFFVLFSSSSACLGTAGQANYAAANAFLDALASYRCRQGLAALSINWGSWAEVGMSALLGERLSLKGEESIPPAQGLQILEQLLLEAPSAVSVGVMPINWPRFLQQQGTSSAFLTDFYDAVRQEPLSKQMTFAQQLESAPAKQRRALLVAHVKSQLTQVLGWNAARPIELKDRFFGMGMDSLTSIELRNRLKNSLGCSLPSTLAFDYPTVEALVNYLSEKVPKGHDIMPSEKRAQENNRVAKALTEVQELSELEAEALLLQELEGFDF